jgi:hypothetical protein
MIGFIKKLFGAKPTETAPAEQCPYKADPAPVVATPTLVVEAAPVVAAPVVEAAPVAAPAPKVAPKKTPAPKKQHVAKKPQAPKVKLPAATKPAGTSKGPRKPRSKPAV